MTADQYTQAGWTYLLTEFADLYRELGPLRTEEQTARLHRYVAEWLNAMGRKVVVGVDVDSVIAEANDWRAENRALVDEWVAGR